MDNHSYGDGYLDEEYEYPSIGFQKWESEPPEEADDKNKEEEKYLYEMMLAGYLKPQSKPTSSEIYDAMLLTKR